MQVVPSGGQICNQCKWRHLVAKIGTNASEAIWWTILQLMKIAPSQVIVSGSVVPLAMFSTTPNDCSFFISIMFILNLLTIFKAISDPFRTTIKPFSFRYAHRLFLSFWQRHSWPQQIVDWWLDSLLDQSLKMLSHFQNSVVFLGTGHAVAWYASRGQKKENAPPPTHPRNVLAVVPPVLIQTVTFLTFMWLKHGGICKPPTALKTTVLESDANVIFVKYPVTFSIRHRK